MDRSGDSYEVGGHGQYDQYDHSPDEYDHEEGEYDHEEGEYDDYGEDMNEVETAFEHESRKIKRDLLDNLNKIRDEKGAQKLYTEFFSSIIADNYAEYLKEGEHDPAYFRELCEQFDVDPEKVELVYTVSKFEEDANILETFVQEFTDLGYLLLEVETDRKVLLDPKNNSIGLGVSINEDSIILVEVFSHKMLAITKINDGEDGGIEIRGKMLTNDMGLYAVILETMETHKKLNEVGFEAIEFDRENKTFIVFMNEVEETIQQSQKLIKFYVRGNPDTIEYRQPRDEQDKIRVKDLTFAMSCPCVVHPDPRYVDEDELDRIRKENEALEKKRQEEERKAALEHEREERKAARKLLRQDIEQKKASGGDIESIISSTQRSERSKSGLSKLTANKLAQADSVDNKSQAQDQSQAAENQSEMSPDKNADKSMTEDDPQIQSDQHLGRSAIAATIKETTVSNKEIKEELEMAINEANKQLMNLEGENKDLQQKIITMKSKTDGSMENKSDVPMTEPKYLNTLAHVHQIRLDLKQTQDRYNRMAAELQMKLEEKQAKCYEIKQAFMDLKREVCKKAANSRTDKPIPEKKIQEWEEKENAKSKDLQALRLENLRLRNQLAKNQKILKKKEELAEGLHLIDFEQLKIENQTLNEKIEERNEELHKLKKKNTTTVQILTHYKEKLEFVIEENRKLTGEGKKKDKDLEQQRHILNEEKGKISDLKNEISSLQQQTGIVNSNSLRKDYDKLIKDNKEDEKKVTYLAEKMQHVEKCIKEHGKHLKQSKLVNQAYGGKSTYYGGSMNGSHASINQGQPQQPFDRQFN